MILVTGGTGFVGRALVRQLVEQGQRVRTLLRPSPRTPNLPRGVPVDVSVVGLNDERGLRAALRGVEVIYHLAGAEFLGRRGNILETDAKGTANLVRAAADSRVQRILYVSHLGASRSSGYSVMKIKGIAEEYIRKSGVPYTILRSALVYGPEDHFTTALARLSALFPFIPVPREGQLLVQPLWVEDLVTCLTWALDNPDTVNETYEIGGSEYFSYREIANLITAAAGTRPRYFPLGLAYLHSLTVTLESLLPNFPFSSYWVEYFSYNRTCPVDVIPRVFGFLPARFAHRLDYLKNTNWKRSALQTFFNPP